MNRFLATIAAVPMLVAGAARAHEVRPLYLQLDETHPGEVAVLLKLPIFRDQGLAAARPRLPATCHESGREPTRESEEALIESWSLRCDAPLTGQTVSIEGFSVLAPDALVQVRFADGRETQYVLSDAHPSVRLEPPGGENPAGSTRLAAYVPIGIEHILFGLDHLMFVLGLMLVVWRGGAGARVLLATVTAFTLAHSLTLAASAIGGFALPGATVETLIALSILMLALELARSLRSPLERPSSLTFRKPWLVAFVFGLLHGFGFAGALQQTGLPAQAQGLALLMFNIGVEAGQLLFIAAAWSAYRVARATIHWPLHRFVAALVWLLGVTSATWMLDRAAGIFFV